MMLLPHGMVNPQCAAGDTANARELREFRMQGFNRKITL
jgi:hypothetical protein